MRKWVELAERCEQATGPDRKIDWAIVEAIGKADFYRTYATKPLLHKGLVPTYTTSLDAITALIERELPGWRVRWHTDGDGVHEAFLEDKGDFDAIDARHTETFAASPALALCAAFCRAMNEKEANA